MRSTMTLCLRPLAALVFVLAMAVPALAAEPGSPQGFLEAIYRTYEGKESKGFPIDKPAVIRRTFVPDLANAMIKDIAAAAKRGDVPELDGDPFIDGQDWEITDVAIRATMNGPAKATAVVTFKNFGKPHTITHELVKTAAGWRIADIKMNERTLRSLYPAKK